MLSCEGEVDDQRKRYPRAGVFRRALCRGRKFRVTKNVAFMKLLCKKSALHVNRACKQEGRKMSSPLRTGVRR